MSESAYYTDEDIRQIGLKKCGKNVKISRKSCLYGPEHMIIGDNSRIDDFCILSGSISLGAYVHIAAFCGLWGHEGIVMEDFAGLSANVLIYSSSDDYSGAFLTNPTVPREYMQTYGGRVILRRHVIIGAGTVILPRVTIGEGAAVGAMSMVSKSLEPWWIYAGVPVKRIKKRKKDLLKLEKMLAGKI
ncbi:MAG: acyltransferase [Syntrophales bacterium]|jgi:galactoside O-acetyltransferase